MLPAFVLLSLALHPFLLIGQSPVLTYHADSTRSGLYAETYLTPANVNSAQFGKLFSYPVDGLVVSQPLYVPNVSISGSSHNVVYVTTQHDSVYAFDADNLGTGAPLWWVNFTNPGAGVTSVPIAEQGCFETGFSEVGIMGTPVISETSGANGATGTLYVVAKTKEVSGTKGHRTTNYVFRLHALDITTGLEQFGGPIVISASMTAQNGNTDVFPQQLNYQRPGLLLQNDIVYVAFGSNGCDFHVTGWLFAMDSGIASGTLQQLAFFNTDQNQTYGGSIWMSGSGPAGDSNGNAFLATANGFFDYNTGGPDVGDTLLKMSYTGGELGPPEDYFTPFDQESMYDGDLDLGSGGVVILPTQPGSYPNLLVQSGKKGAIYLVDSDTGSMGGYSSAGNSCLWSTGDGVLGQDYSTPTYWTGPSGTTVVYFSAKNDSVKGFTLSSGDGIPSLSQTVVSNRVYSGGVPLISANGSTNGILWDVFNIASPTLYAFDASSLIELYDSGQIKSRDALGPAAHFVAPMVANGRVYVGSGQTGGTGQLIAYGVLPFFNPVGGNNQSGTVGTTLPVALSVQALNSAGVGVPGVTVKFSGGKGGTFSNPNPITDSTGTASTMFTLPTKAQSLTIVASAAGYRSASFTETAVAGTPTSIVTVSGTKQTGTVGSPLPEPIAVRLKDQYSNGVSGLPVTFSDAGVGGNFSANPVTTDATGTATVSYTLPTKAQSVLITASYSTLQVSFRESAVAGSPASQKVLSGNNQTGPPSTQLPKALVVDVMDVYGNPVAGVSVSFSDGGAGGTFSANPVITTSNGQGSVNYTTPSQDGAVTITASVANISPVMFHETVQ
jgi:hypothetical protein